MSLSPTLEDMEVSHMAATQQAAEQKLTQNAITAVGAGETIGKWLILYSDWYFLTYHTVLFLRENES